jgi:hypothetical protein
VLTPSTQPSTYQDLKRRVLQLWNGLDKESDRAAVIIIGAWLEHALGDLIRAKLTPSAASSDPLLEGAQAPVSSVSAR